MSSALEQAPRPPFANIRVSVPFSLMLFLMTLVLQAIVRSFPGRTKQELIALLQLDRLGISFEDRICLTLFDNVLLHLVIGGAVEQRGHPDPERGTYWTKPPEVT